MENKLKRNTAKNSTRAHAKATEVAIRLNSNRNVINTKRAANNICFMDTA